MSNLSQRNWETISIPSRNLDFMWTICIINSFRCIRDSLWFAPHRSMANKLGRTCGESWIFTVACQEEFAGKIDCSLLQSTECYCSQLMRLYRSMNEDDLWSKPAVKIQVFFVFEFEDKMFVDACNFGYFLKSFSKSYSFYCLNCIVK